MRLVIVTGVSGAGKSTALRALEDLGFYAVDNLPLPLVPQLLDLLATLETPATLARYVAKTLNVLDRLGFEVMA